MSFSMSWAVNGVGGNIKNPIWDDIEKKLTALKGQSGALTIDIFDNDVGPQLLQVRTEAGVYLVTLGEIVDDDYDVRTYYDKDSEDVMIGILGDFWPKKQLTTDFSFVTNVFREFFHTGNVQKSLLN
jgi:hypothetical protein